MEETHEYANELGKQGGKNPRKIPKFSINHERFSRNIEKKSKITPTHSSDGILSDECVGVILDFFSIVRLKRS